MLCVVVKGPSYEEVRSQIRAALFPADIIEIRVDLLSYIDLPLLADIRATSPLPLIFTLRSVSQGGKDVSSSKEREQLLLSLAQLQPCYLDIEYPTDVSIAKSVSPSQLILSSHLFASASPSSCYKEMRKTPARFYKLALGSPHTPCTLQHYLWARDEKRDDEILISLGPAGRLSRILSPLLRNPLTYASLEEDPSSPLGQHAAETLKKRYRFSSLSPQTALYGLIGDPISTSISDHTHNVYFQTLLQDALYLKMPLTIEQLPAFLSLAKQLPFKGLSVTMPLKEAIVPYLDSLAPSAQEIGAVNTLVLQEGSYTGYNTDGEGALNALERSVSVQGKRVVFVGAGGAAKAIAYEARKRGARSMIFVNRHLDKAQDLAWRYQGEARRLEEMPLCAQEGYDVLIYCCPVDLPLVSENLLPSSCVLDIRTRPKDTPLLVTAKERGCLTVPGYEMFCEQALLQFALWGIPSLPPGSLHKFALEVLDAAFPCTSIHDK